MDLLGRAPTSFSSRTTPYSQTANPSFALLDHSFRGGLQTLPQVRGSNTTFCIFFVGQTLFCTIKPCLRVFIAPSLFPLHYSRNQHCLHSLPPGPARAGTSSPHPGSLTESFSILHPHPRPPPSTGVQATVPVSLGEGGSHKPLVLCPLKAKREVRSWEGRARLWPRIVKQLETARGRLSANG